jgi:hypothetical protein
MSQFAHNYRDDVKHELIKLNVVADLIDYYILIHTHKLVRIMITKSYAKQSLNVHNSTTTRVYTINNTICAPWPASIHCLIYTIACCF